MRYLFVGLFGILCWTIFGMMVWKFGFWAATIRTLITVAAWAVVFWVIHLCESKDWKW